MIDPLSYLPDEHTSAVSSCKLSAKRGRAPARIGRIHWTTEWDTVNNLTQAV
jgi:hypothetical protein